jgi:hypothetical protein
LSLSAVSCLFRDPAAAVPGLRMTGEPTRRIRSVEADLRGVEKGNPIDIAPDRHLEFF